ncbi:hypothetical protein METBIDRAFT_143259 [Metschnikowia bicuspidata var. bicuspidata NRRL YB-4993]|uniref:Uncharacterized protein n=1 Tax=Metschnikowia bicuspidata var. bicuspidata NRRL YB-4993 TaxID=869754 RepID=A0A1A0HD63_9ASCO|nr:hypothetical protein METBIDRAFT_143259 [Metschnikowia bicuspidata var. bicuspidata NRRL YB-4993]OBA21956.1 hypothetical protein METBIDRAFT_143259 [Metschnikowia bicuspidata var. bicuspidata NRRL YB-4993]
MDYYGDNVRGVYRERVENMRSRHGLPGGKEKIVMDIQLGPTRSLLTWDMRPVLAYAREMGACSATSREFPCGEARASAVCFLGHI